MHTKRDTQGVGKGDTQVFPDLPASSGFDSSLLTPSYKGNIGETEEGQEKIRKSRFS